MNFSPNPTHDCDIKSPAGLTRKGFRGDDIEKREKNVIIGVHIDVVYCTYVVDTHIPLWARSTNPSEMLPADIWVFHSE